MPFDSRVQHFLSYLNKPRGPSAKLALIPIQRHARNLMSLASLSGFCAVVWWLVIALFVWSASGVSSIDPSSAQKVLVHWHWLPKTPFDASALTVAWLLFFVATMAPIVCLRSLGKALYIHAALSFMVARRFVWLGRALVVNIVVGFAASLIAASQIKDYQLGLGLGFWGTFIAAVLAFVVAEVVREGALAAEENREFV